MSKLVSSVCFPVYSVFQVFDGNSDRNTVKENKLEVPIYTRYFRLHPKTFHNHISMRLELHGCQTGTFFCKLTNLERSAINLKQFKTHVRRLDVGNILDGCSGCHLPS